MSWRPCRPPRPGPGPPEVRRAWWVGLAVLVAAAAVGLEAWVALRPGRDPQAVLDRFASDVNGVVRNRLLGAITEAGERGEEQRLRRIAAEDAGCGRVDLVVNVGTGWQMRWVQESAIRQAEAEDAEFVSAEARPAGLAGEAPQPFVSVVAGGWDC